MSIPVQCPACQHAFAVADRFAGKKGKCPKCGMIFVAAQPSPAGDAPLAPASEPVVPGPKRAAPRPAAGAPLPPSPVPRASAAPAVYDSGPVDTFATVPMGVPVSVAPVSPAHVSNAPAAPAFVIGQSDSGEHRLSSRRSKQSPLPLVIGALVGGLALIGVVLGVVWSLGGDTEKPVAKKHDEAEAAPADPDSDEPTPDTESPAIATPAMDIAALEPLRPRVLTLEIKSSQGTTRGVCFLVAERGFAVTPWQPIAQATSVEAITADDVRVRVAGTSAIDAERNLAIIKLEPSLPIPLDKLDLSLTDPQADTDAAAIEVAAAKPVVAGKFKSTDTFTRLSPTVRAKLKNLASDWADDTGIVLHNVKLSTQSCGAPLLSPEGRVLGVHLVNDPATSLAIHVRHVAALLENAGGDIKPFGGESVAASDPLPMVTPTPMVEPEPMPAPRPADPIDDLVARIKEHRAECERMNWVAQDAADYAQFQLFAKFTHEAATLADAAGTSGEAKEKLQVAVREGLFSLTAEKWPTDTAWNKTNAQAMKALETPGEGVFALARMVVPTAQGNMLGDVPIALVEVAGESQMLVLPLSTGGEKFGVGDQVLVIGLHDPAVVVQFRNSNVPLVRTKYVLGVAQQD